MLRTLSMRGNEQLDSQTIEARITIYYESGDENQILRMGNHTSSQKFYLDIATLGSIPMTSRLNVVLDKNTFTLSHDDEFEADYFPRRVVFSFHTEDQYAHFCFYNMALKCCNLTVRNSNATIKPKETPNSEFQVDENPYEMIDDPLEYRAFDKVKKWIDRISGITHKDGKSKKAAEGSLPVSRTSSNNSCSAVTDVYRDPSRPVISKPTIDKETTERITQNYTLVHPLEIENLHRNEGTYETIQPLLETPPRYLDPSDSHVNKSQSTTPRSTPPPPPSATTSRSNSLSRPNKTPPRPPPKENKPNYSSCTFKSTVVSSISEAPRRNSSETFNDIKSRFEQPGAAPVFRLSTSAHNTPKSTRKSEKKIEIKPTVVNSSATRTGVQDVKPINPQKSTRISNVIKTGLSEGAMTLQERLRALQEAGIQQ